MEPIINPWFIYWINIITNLHAAFGLAAAISLVIFLFSVCGFSSVYLNEEEQSTAKKIMKISAAVLFSAGIILIFLPDKETMMTMLALQYTTPDNIQIVQGNVVDFVKNIAEAAKGLK